jgi:hypothetical protein
MSRSGNETLLKAVFQAILAFIMSCFPLTIITCDKMKSIVANRWWGLEDKKKRIHWKSWVWLSSPKALGRMAFETLGYLTMQC